jgi:hypothetical protein
MFKKSERKSLKFAFAKWCSYNMTALNYKMWKFKYLFYDYKVIIYRIFNINFDFQKYRRKNKYYIESLETYNIDKINWDDIFIGWQAMTNVMDNKPNNINVYKTLYSIKYDSYEDIINKKYNEFISKI